MRRFLTFTLLLLVVVLGLLACSKEEDNNRAIFSPDQTADKSEISGNQQYLSALWALSESVEYDVISSTISCDDGGAFLDVPASWQPAYSDRVFGLNIPPHAWDPDIYGASVTFEIRVPRSDSIMPCCEAPMFFEVNPIGFDGIQFLKPVQITFSDHPALNSWCGEDLFFSFDEDTATGALFLDDQFIIAGVPFQGERNPNCGIGRTASVMHFSKWGRKNGTSASEGGGLPGGIGNLGSGGLCPDLMGGLN